jgi:hypothetical protein
MDDFLNEYSHVVQGAAKLGPISAGCMSVVEPPDDGSNNACASGGCGGPDSAEQGGLSELTKRALSGSGHGFPFDW